MPGLVKIGKTTRDPDGRAREMQTTGVPTPFEVVEYVFSPDCGALEREMHEAFKEQRVSEGREFFAVDPHEVTTILYIKNMALVSEWVDLFSPDSRLVYEPYFVEPAKLKALASELDCHPFQVATIIGFLEPEDLQNAKSKYETFIESRNRK